MIEINGDFGEGGGQILRTALALSAITQKPFKISKIRANRPKPGLKPSHKNCILALEQLCNAKCEGDHYGSEELTFFPGELKPKTIKVDIGTAGSITLLLQSIILPMIFSSYIHKTTIKAVIKGGTDVKWSMTVDYFYHVIIPYFRTIADINLYVIKRGFYPVGGGEIELKVRAKEKARQINQLDYVQRYPIARISSIASKSLYGRKVAERQASIVERLLKIPVTKQIQYVESDCPGSSITISALYDEENNFSKGTCIIGEKGKTSEQLAENVFSLFENELTNEPVDEYAADNIVPLIALFGGAFRTTKISQHTLANAYVVKNFLGEIKINGKERIIKNEVYKDFKDLLAQFHSSDQ